MIFDERETHRRDWMVVLGGDPYKWVLDANVLNMMDNFILPSHNKHRSLAVVRPEKIDTLSIPGILIKKHSEITLQTP